MNKTLPEGFPYWRISSVYFSYFAVVGAMSPFWGLYLETLGFKAHAIGILAAIPMLSKLGAPNLWGYFADRYGHRLTIIRMGAFAAAFCFLGVVYFRDFYSLVIFTAAFSFFWSAILAQFEVSTLSYLKNQPEQYSKIRLWGSLGFIAAVLGLGAIFDVVSVLYLPYFILAFLIAIFLSASMLPGARVKGQVGTHKIFWTILKKPAVLGFLIVYFLIQYSHGVYYTFYSIHLVDVGLSKLSVAMLWTVGVVAEIILFLKIPSLLKRKNASFVLLTSTLALTTLRWFLIGWFPSNLWLGVFAQMIHAFSFGAAHVVAIEFIRRRFGHECQSQGQALYSAVTFGGGAALGAYSSGLLWPLGPHFAFGAAMCASALAFLYCLVFLRRAFH